MNDPLDVLKLIGIQEQRKGLKLSEFELADHVAEAAANSLKTSASALADALPSVFSAPSVIFGGLSSLKSLSYAWGEQAADVAENYAWPLTSCIPTTQEYIRTLANSSHTQAYTLANQQLEVLHLVITRGSPPPALPVRSAVVACGPHFDRHLHMALGEREPPPGALRDFVVRLLHTASITGPNRLTEAITLALMRFTGAFVNAIMPTVVGLCVRPRSDAMLLLTAASCANIDSPNPHTASAGLRLVSALARSHATSTVQPSPPRHPPRHALHTAHHTLASAISSVTDVATSATNGATRGRAALALLALPPSDAATAAVAARFMGGAATPSEVWGGAQHITARLRTHPCGARRVCRCRASAASTSATGGHPTIATQVAPHADRAAGAAAQLDDGWGYSLRTDGPWGGIAAGMDGHGVAEVAVGRAEEGVWSAGGACSAADTLRVGGTRNDAPAGSGAGLWGHTPLAMAAAAARHAQALAAATACDRMEHPLALAAALALLVELAVRCGACGGEADLSWRREAVGHHDDCGPRSADSPRGSAGEGASDLCTAVCGCADDPSTAYPHTRPAVPPTVDIETVAYVHAHVARVAMCGDGTARAPAGYAVLMPLAAAAALANLGGDGMAASPVACTGAPTATPTASSTAPACPPGALARPSNAPPPPTPMARLADVAERFIRTNDPTAAHAAVAMYAAAADAVARWAAVVARHDPLALAGTAPPRALVALHGTMLAVARSLPRFQRRTASVAAVQIGWATGRWAAAAAAVAAAGNEAAHAAAAHAAAAHATVAMDTARAVVALLGGGRHDASADYGPVGVAVEAAAVAYEAAAACSHSGVPGAVWRAARRLARMVAAAVEVPRSARRGRDMYWETLAGGMVAMGGSRSRRGCSSATTTPCGCALRTGWWWATAPAAVASGTRIPPFPPMCPCCAGALPPPPSLVAALAACAPFMAAAAAAAATTPTRIASMPPYISKPPPRCGPYPPPTQQLTYMPTHAHPAVCTLAKVLAMPFPPPHALGSLTSRATLALCSADLLPPAALDAAVLAAVAWRPRPRCADWTTQAQSCAGSPARPHAAPPLSQHAATPPWPRAARDDDADVLAARGALASGAHDACGGDAPFVWGHPVAVPAAAPAAAAAALAALPLPPRGAQSPHCAPLHPPSTAPPPPPPPGPLAGTGRARDMAQSNPTVATWWASRNALGAVPAALVAAAAVVTRASARAASASTSFAPAAARGVPPMRPGHAATPSPAAAAAAVESLRTVADGVLRIALRGGVPPTAAAGLSRATGAVAVAAAAARRRLWATRGCGRCICSCADHPSRAQGGGMAAASAYGCCAVCVGAAANALAVAAAALASPSAVAATAVGGAAMVTGRARKRVGVQRLLVAPAGAYDRRGAGGARAARWVAAVGDVPGGDEVDDAVAAAAERVAARG